MLRPLRSLLGIGLILGALWAMFAIDLGGRTFAEHMDTISETPEAQELVDGARSKVNPALQELRDRVLGEYVEAPTWIPDPTNFAGEPATETGPVSLDEDETIPARTLEPGASFEPALPGRRPPTALDEDPSLQPPLPGRR